MRRTVWPCSLQDFVRHKPAKAEDPPKALRNEAGTPSRVPSSGSNPVRRGRRAVPAEARRAQTGKQPNIFVSSGYVFPGLCLRENDLRRAGSTPQHVPQDPSF